MIQVCSRCGTRWNVRDRERQWCPRCHGTLLSPQDSQQWIAFSSSSGHARPPSRPRSGGRLPSGYRWIAVRPGAGPPPRRRRGPLGPTPRYAFIPPWGLVDPATQVSPAAAAPRPGPSPGALRATLLTTIVVFGVAALLHIARYALLIINRSLLLNSVVAGLATWLAVAASVGAMFSIVGCAFVLTEWLIGRRAAAFEHRGEAEPRRVWALRAGCLVPLANVAWAPTYVVELATAEDRYPHVRRLIWAWWLLFALSTLVSVFATATSFPSGAQGIANNTVAFIVAYLMAMAATMAVARVVFAFEGTPVERPSHRWVVVADEKESRADSPPTVEREGQEPAA